MTARALVDRGGTLVGLALVAAIFGALVGAPFFAPANLELMARQTAIVGMAAIGMTMVIVAGGIDLSVGSVIALSTVVIALLLKGDHGPWVAALGGIGAGAICGLANGLLITRLRVVPFIVTLGTMLIVRGAAKGLAEERRIEAPTTWLNDLLRSGAHGTWLPAGIWLVVVLALVVGAVLGYTRFGRHLFAIGSNERMARLCGVRVERCKVAMYAGAAAFTGVAGLLQFSKLSVGDPTVAVGLELDVIAAVIIGGGSIFGGYGSVLGSLAGAAVTTLLRGLMSLQIIGADGSSFVMPQHWVNVGIGVILIGAVLIDIWVRQEGILGQLFDRLRRLSAPRQPTPARRVAP